MKNETKEKKVPSGVTPIVDSGADYKKGGVLEASRFAKGDGWSAAKPGAKTK